MSVEDVEECETAGATERRHVRSAYSASAEFRAATRFIKALEAMDREAQRAWILYLADRFLGLKWNWFRR